MATKTRHYEKRIQQRGIRPATIELALRYGLAEGEDRMVLRRKEILSALKAVDIERKNLVHALDQGGVVVAQGDNGALVTAFRFDSYKRP
tara:strand:+ start:374 stop:643 length:270 start_codon:yes stop_codon:yes gene_type:complete